MKRVLVVEDDGDIAELVSIHLRDLGCEVTLAYDGDRALQLALQESFDFIVLDIMIPGIDGLEVCKRLRAADVSSPILMLTSKSEEIDKVLGLELGADDYLSKPFGIREFIARVKAIFRRTTLNTFGGDLQQALSIQIEDLIIDRERHKVLINGVRVELTPKEYSLLELMANHPGKSYSREDLLNLIWGYEFVGYEHTVNSHINRLRSKIESDYSKPKYILTTWGVGYRFTDEIPIKEYKNQKQ